MVNQPTRILPFVKPPENDGEQWDGWSVEPSGDHAKDYAQGEDYARQAVAEARNMNDPAPVTYTLAWLYGKAHLAGKSSGAIEKGFVDQIVKLAMKAALN
jgi:hypothetical protein